MKQSKKNILAGAGRYGEEALRFFGADSVYCFADNYRQGQDYCEKKVISFDELKRIHLDYQIILSVGYPSLEELSNQLSEAGITFVSYWDVYETYCINSPDDVRIASYKNRHKGEKCFLVGNGSSLLPSDLDKIKKHNHVSIACNFIQRIFDRTDWRPEYYCCEELSVVLLNSDFIMNYPMKAKFIKKLLREEDKKLFSNAPEDVHFYSGCVSKRDISSNVAKVIYNGFTVMFTMLQIAMYMGFSEIYLIGVDNTQPPGPHTKKFAELQSHFYTEDLDELKRRRELLPKFGFDDDWDKYNNLVNAHYMIARDYAEEHCIKIFNATRGGHLEVFERIDIDELIGD